MGAVVADGPRYAAYLRVMALQPARHLVDSSLRHLWRGQPVDPTNKAALQAREEELRAGGLYLEFSWAFVLRPVTVDRTRLLLGPQQRRPAVAGGVAGCPHRPGGCL